MGVRNNVTNAWDALRGRQRGNPVGGSLFDKLSKSWGTGDSWAKTSYGHYYPQSVSVYAAIKLRQEAIARVPLFVYRQTDDGQEKVEPDHPLQSLLNRVNRWWTRGDLWRATETYLSLWGSAYWALTREGNTITEIWPLRPDKMKILPDEQDYIKGFVYGTSTDKRAFAPDEIVWFRYFNPLDEYSGLSPIAPVALSVDMGVDALQTNRSALANDATPGMIISVSDSPTDEEVMSFYQRWESRYAGPKSARRPAILSEGMTASNLGFSPKDMMSLESMRWSNEDVARVFNVPTPMLHDLSRATYANIMTARKSFWEDCIGPQLAFYEEELTELLLPLYGEEGLVVRFDTSKVPALQEDEDARAARREKYVKANILTINEVRADMGLEAVEWGDKPSAPSPAPLPAMSMSDANTSTRSLSWEADGRAIDTAQRRKAKKLEEAMRRDVSALFRKQANSVIREFEKQEDAERAISGNGSDTAVATRAAPVINTTEWIPQFTALARKHLAASLMGGAETVNKKYQFGISFDITAPAVKGWIASRTKWWANAVNDSTAKTVMGIVSKGRKEGTGPIAIAKKLREYREFATTKRSERVARTEVGIAQTQGTLQTFKQADVPAKRWYTALDERVRDSHSAVHGHIRKQSEQFRVGNDSMDGPGQGSDPSENINCRCVVLPEGLGG